MMHDIWSMNIYDIGYMIHEKYMIHDICHIIFDECYMIHDIWYMIYNKWCMIYDILFVIIYMIYDLWFQIHDMIYVICDFGSMELVLDCTQDDIFDFPRETCICFAGTYPFCCFFLRSWPSFKWVYPSNSHCVGKHYLIKHQNFRCVHSLLEAGRNGAADIKMEWSLMPAYLGVVVL